MFHYITQQCTKLSTHSSIYQDGGKHTSNYWKSRSMNACELYHSSNIPTDSTEYALFLVDLHHIWHKKWLRYTMCLKKHATRLDVWPWPVISRSFELYLGTKSAEVLKVCSSGMMVSLFSRVVSLLSCMNHSVNGSVPNNTKRILLVNDDSVHRFWAIYIGKS